MCCGQASAAKTLSAIASACSQQITYQLQTLVPLFCIELYSATEVVEDLIADQAESGESIEAEEEITG